MQKCCLVINNMSQMSRAAINYWCYKQGMMLVPALFM